MYVVDIFSTYLFILKFLAIFIAIIIAISSIDDLIIDVVYWVRRLIRSVTVYRHHPKMQYSSLMAIEEKPLAIMVPAWHETGVIGKMAELAAKHEVKVYTVGIGTPEGDVVHIQGRSMRVKLEDEALKKVSAITQGEYFRADSTEGLKAVYDKLGYKLRFEKRAMSEVSAELALLGMLLIMASITRNFVRMGKII